MRSSRIILAGLSGGAGKTILSLGTTRAWTRRGLTVRPYKKGPDYIDAMWLGLAARNMVSNLDPFIMSEETLASLFWNTAPQADVAVIEGNRGLYDGMDVEGSCSTAALARTLSAPVVLIMDCTKMTRTAAAVVAGVRHFEEGFHLAGVVLNRTAGPRHRDMLRQAIEHYTDVPVLGALPKVLETPIPERHMGLMSNREWRGGEHGDGPTPDQILDQVADLIENNVDLDRILEIAKGAPDGPAPDTLPPLWPEGTSPETPPAEDAPLIGYVHDAALWFYYEENFDALRAAGARLVELSLLDKSPWPDLDGLYLGGGFPETHGEHIRANPAVRDRVLALSRAGLPIYAECGGFMFLGQSLVVGDEEYPMAGVFPVRTELLPKPQGLGYVEVEVTKPNPFHPTGSVLKGHEFHYSRCLPLPGADLAMALAMQRGTGMHDGCDGLVTDNTFACYTHTHALGTPHWAPNFVAAARKWKEEKKEKY